MLHCHYTSEQREAKGKGEERGGGGVVERGGREGRAKKSIRFDGMVM